MDANAVKASMRWRTALVVQELEAEIEAARRAKTGERAGDMLRRKDDLSEHFNGLKNSLTRYADGAGAPSPPHAVDEASAALARTRARAPGRHEGPRRRARAYLYDEGHTFNKHWGYLTRASAHESDHAHD
ncbi:hypothetical protein SO694_000372118 [Aureococcus anophagefferens]|uniref:Uncharacterized protein n=1 Tax=Aureococcus anophagefferens TaxID=44056 RepID=A0ABR1FL40_AURAN